MEAQSLIVGNLVVTPSHPEWGVGIVEHTSAGDVHVFFSRRGVGVRVCSAQLLERHRYTVNNTVYSRAEQAYGTIQRVRETEGRTTYVVRFARGQKNIPEYDIAPEPPASDPLEMLRNAEVEAADPFVLGVQARQMQHAYHSPDLVSLNHARIDVLPHQVSVAYRVLSQQPRRFLLADEVGLGKTIETGLIIKELRARGMAARVLIIVPGNLVPQWIEELHKKFNEHFTRLDATTLPTYAALHGPEEVWHTFDSIITSLHLLRAYPTYVEALARQTWDLIIFDEAHHLRRSLNAGTDGDQRTTHAYRIAERLAPRTDALLLLTATPLQLHPFELFSLVQLLDPTLFPTFATFEAQRERIPTLNEIVRHLQRWETVSSEAQDGVARDAARMLHGLSDAPSSYSDQLLQDLRASVDNRRSVQDRMRSLHPFAPVILRNRKRRVFPDAPRRTVRTLHVQFSPAERAAYNAVTAYLRDTYNQALADQNQVVSFVMVVFHRMLTSSSYALRRSLGRRIDRLLQLQGGRKLLHKQAFGVLEADEFEELENLLERYGDLVLDVQPNRLDVEVARLRELCGLLDGIMIDAKTSRLLEALAEIMYELGQKVIIFTQFKQTLFYLHGILRMYYRVALFYGDMDVAEKDRVVDEFRDPQGAQILIATEAGGEGRNLQFCHILFNYDLPWNPMKVEQRIGRLDRIGQQHPVAIYNFIVEGTIEERMLQVLQDRIRLFEASIGGLDPILGTIERDVEGLLMSNDVTEQQIRRFEDQVVTQARQVQAVETGSNDEILDTSSFDSEQVAALLRREPAVGWRDIQAFVLRFLEHTGGRCVERANGIYELHVPKQVRVDAAHELRDTYRVTFNPEVARRHEQLDFVAFGHPLLKAAVAACLDGNTSDSTAVLLLSTPDIPPVDAVCAVYECVLDGIRPRKELFAIAVDPQGTYLGTLSDRFPALVAHAQDCSPDEDVVRTFADTIDTCINELEVLASARIRETCQRYENENERAYMQERQKQEQFWAAKIGIARRSVEQLQVMLHEQRANADSNTRRIIPATEGRLMVAQQSVEMLERERDARMQRLAQQRQPSSMTEVLAAAYVAVRPQRRTS